MVKNYFKAIRIKNLGLLSLLFWGLMLHNYSGSFSIKTDQILLFLSIITTTAAGYLINNYFDLKSDVINNKNISGLSKKKYCLIYIAHVFLSFIFLFASDISPAWIQLVMVCHFIIYLYSLKLQHWPLIGNLVVSLLCSIVVFIPYWIFNDHWSFKSLDLLENINDVFVIFCFLFTLKREIIKDMEDLDGDLKTSSYTLPVLFGNKASKIILTIIITISLIFTGRCFYESTFKIINLVFFIPIISLILFSIFKIYQSSNKVDYKKLSSIIKIKFLVAGFWLYISL